MLYVSSPDGQENIKEQEEVKNEKKGRKRKKKKALISKECTPLFSLPLTGSVKVWCSRQEEAAALPSRQPTTRGIKTKEKPGDTYNEKNKIK